MNTARATTGLALTMILAVGCSGARDPDGPLVGISGGDDDAPTTSLGDDADASGSDDTVDDPADETADDSADDPLADCQSVQQSATVEDRPNDVLLVADPQTDQKLIQAAVTNLMPQLESEGVFDTRLVLVAGTPPPLDPQEEYGDCDRWDCWGDHGTHDYHWLDETIGQQTLLTDLMALQGQWQPLMRDDAWKHVWIQSNYGTDTMMEASDFVATFSGLGPLYNNFTAHALITGGPTTGDFRDLVEATGGELTTFEMGGEVYIDFVEGVKERLKANPLSCRYAIPEPPAGLSFANDEVNVDYDDGLGVRTLGYVDDPARCAEFEHGWYYDDPALPTQILVCPETCGVFRNAEQAEIMIRFGCRTTPVE